MLIAVSSFGESLRRDYLTAPAEAVFIAKDVIRYQVIPALQQAKLL